MEYQCTWLGSLVRCTVANEKSNKPIGGNKMKDWRLTTSPVTDKVYVCKLNNDGSTQESKVRCDKRFHSCSYN